MIMLARCACAHTQKRECKRNEKWIERRKKAARNEPNRNVHKRSVAILNASAMERGVWEGEREGNNAKSIKGYNNVTVDMYSYSVNKPLSEHIQYYISTQYSVRFSSCRLRFLCCRGCCCCCYRTVFAFHFMRFNILRFYGSHYNFTVAFYFLFNPKLYFFVFFFFVFVLMKAYYNERIHIMHPLRNNMLTHSSASYVFEQQNPTIVTPCACIFMKM